MAKNTNLPYTISRNNKRVRIHDIDAFNRISDDELHSLKHYTKRTIIITDTLKMRHLMSDFIAGAYLNKPWYSRSYYSAKWCEKSNIYDLFDEMFDAPPAENPLYHQPFWDYLNETMQETPICPDADIRGNFTKMLAFIVGIDITYSNVYRYRDDINFRHAVAVYSGRYSSYSYSEMDMKILSSFEKTRIFIAKGEIDVSVIRNFDPVYAFHHLINIYKAHINGRPCVHWMYWAKIIYYNLNILKYLPKFIRVHLLEMLLDETYDNREPDGIRGNLEFHRDEIENELDRLNNDDDDPELLNVNLLTI